MSTDSAQDLPPLLESLLLEIVNQAREFDDAARTIELLRRELRQAGMLPGSEYERTTFSELVAKLVAGPYLLWRLANADAADLRELQRSKVQEELKRHQEWLLEQHKQLLYWLIENLESLLVELRNLRTRMAHTGLEYSAPDSDFREQIDEHLQIIKFCLGERDARLPDSAWDTYQQTMVTVHGAVPRTLIAIRAEIRTASDALEQHDQSLVERTERKSSKTRNSAMLWIAVGTFIATLIGILVANDGF